MTSYLHADGSKTKQKATMQLEIGLDDSISTVSINGAEVDYAASGYNNTDGVLIFGKTAGNPINVSVAILHFKKAIISGKAVGYVAITSGELTLLANSQSRIKLKKLSPF